MPNSPRKESAVRCAKQRFFVGDSAYGLLWIELWSTNIYDHDYFTSRFWLTVNYGYFRHVKYSKAFKFSTVLGNFPSLLWFFYFTVYGDFPSLFFPFGTYCPSVRTEPSQMFLQLITDHERNSLLYEWYFRDFHISWNIYLWESR